MFSLLIFMDFGEGGGVLKYLSMTIGLIIDGVASFENDRTIV